MLRIAASIVVGIAGPASAQPAIPDPRPPGYGSPPPPGWHCAAVSHNPLAPHRVLCDLRAPRALDGQCACPLPPALPGLPLPPAHGHVVP